jgi:AcrR family transcriptional regulator
MFKTIKAEQTRTSIAQSALRLFREKGFDATTMRDIAAESNVALGSAYYYFPSKEAIIFDFYENVHSQHERLVAESVESGKLDLRERLQFSLSSKIDICASDRRLLGVIFRFAGEPDHPLSVLGPATLELRRKGVQVFRTALGDERLPKDLEQLLPLSLWALQMGLLALLIYDNSRNQQRTRRLASASIDLTVRLLTLAKLPLVKPIRTRILAMLEEADLLGALAAKP